MTRTNRTVYLNKAEESYSNSSLANISDFVYVKAYHDHTRYNGSPLYARGLFFDPSGVNMYIGEYATPAINKYTLSTPWDIQTATFTQNAAIGSITQEMSFCFDSKGELLFVGADEEDPTLDSINMYRLSGAWDITGITEDITPEQDFTTDTSGIFGLSVSQSSPLVNTSYISYSGISVVLSTITTEDTYAISGDIVELEMLSSGYTPYGTFMGQSDQRIHVLYSESSDHKINQYYRNGNTFEFEDNLLLTTLDSGNIGITEAFYIEKHGNYLYTLNTSGVVHQYEPNSQQFFGSFDSGVSLDDLSTALYSGDTSISNYIDEGITFLDTTDFITSVASGLSKVFLRTEIPYMENVSGVWLETAYNTINSGMVISKIELYTDRITGITPNGYNYYNHLVGVDIDINHVLESGINTKQIDITTNALSLNAMGGISPLTLSFDLYSPESGNKIVGMNVLMSGDMLPTPINDNITLFVSGDNQVINDLDLFINGPTQSTSGLSLFLANTYTPSSIPLFIQGHESITNSTTLFTLAGTAFDMADLFIHGHDSLNSGTDLYIQGHLVESSSIPLYTTGRGQSSGIFPLYTVGQTPYDTNDSLPLFMWSTTNSGIMNTAPLFIGMEGNPEPKYNLNLFLMGQEFGSGIGSMPLYIYNDNSLSAGLDLFIKNEYSELSGIVPLYISAPGILDGGLPSSSIMPLFISRSSEAFAASVPLYIVGPSVTTSGIDLTILGGNSGLTDNITLYTLGAGQINNATKLFTKGL